MLENYLRVACINILKTKKFSFITVFGLALGMSLCMVIITIINDQLSYDTFHPDADRIFRINTESIRKNGGTERYASTPFPLSNAIQQDNPYIKQTVTLVRRLNGELVSGDKQILAMGFYTAPEFFDLFGFEMLYGDKATALNQPRSVVLSEEMSERFYKDEDPVGKVITMNGLGDFTITGVLKKSRVKTHLEFDLLGSSSSLATLDTGEFQFSTDWTNIYTTYTYVLLSGKEKQADLDKELASIFTRYYGNLELESRDKGYTFYSQALNHIVPGPVISNNLGRALPLQFIWFLTAFALIVMISAAFNYNSLSIARAMSRAKEIGIRKSAGALRHQLVFQFLIESVLTSLIALVLGVTIFHFVLKPMFEGLRLAQEFDMSMVETPSLFVLFALFSIIIGIFSGLLPAFYLSSVNPSRALKDLSGFQMSPKLGLRKVLLVIQFTAAIVFMITLMNIYRQMNYVLHADYGFRKDDIINVDLQGNDYAKTVQAFSSVSGVKEISGISHSLGTSRDRSVDVRIKDEDEKTGVRDYTIDHHYASNLDLQFVAGKNFLDDLPDDRELFVIVNETFVKDFGLGTPAEAIGKNLILSDSLNVAICGVVKDFHFRPFTYNIEPLLLRHYPPDISQLNVQINSADAPSTLARLESSWKSLDKSHPFTYQFFNDELKDSYAEFNDMTSLLGLVAFMALAIACLGLFGLVILFLQQRVKEIGVRKILGASITQLSILLSRKFSLLILLACLVGLPLSILLNIGFMEIFAYRVNPVAGYVWGILMIMIIAVVTTGTQIIRAAIVSPVKSLRTE